MTDQTTAVVLVSGGIDSATCLALACEDHDNVIPLHVNYGQQTHDVEAERAERLTDHFNTEPLRFIDYKPVMKHFAGGVASNRDSFVTEGGDLEEEDGRSTGYQPMRNLHLIATASGVADVNDADVVYHGAQGGDEASYPDCRPKFMTSAYDAVNRSLADGDHIGLRTPLLNLEKYEVIQLGEKAGVPWEFTYSCYEQTDFDDPVACSDCPACEERQEGFDKAGVEDPVQYE